EVVVLLVGLAGLGDVGSGAVRCGVHRVLLARALVDWAISSSPSGYPTSSRHNPCAWTTATAGSRRPACIISAVQAGSRRPSPTVSRQPTSDRTMLWQKASAT